MTTHTVTHCPDNLFYCLIDGTRQRWDKTRRLITADDVKRLMLAQMAGETLEITATIEPQPEATVMAGDEFREPSDSEFLAMLRTNH
jgi:hypothetical protein